MKHGLETLRRLMGVESRRLTWGERLLASLGGFTSIFAILLISRHSLGEAALCRGTTALVCDNLLTFLALGLERTERLLASVGWAVKTGSMEKVSSSAWICSGV